MSDADDSTESDEELASIRERRRAELERKLREGTLGREDDGRSDGAAGAAPDEPVYVSGPEHLNELSAEHDVVLVDFYADWCGPCQMLEPTLEDVARSTDALVAKVDVDANQRLAATYGARSIPTLVLLVGGTATERLVGVQQRARLVELVERHS